MTMLKSGWVIVGSTPSNDGTTRTKGDGCLLVLDANGQLVATWTGPDINGPWGNMAVIDNGTTATLFVSMAGFDVPGPQVRDPNTGYPVTIDKATVLRIDLAIPPGKPPAIKSQTVVADGFGQRADRDVFLIGPTGLALAPDDTLYVSDALANRIVAIPDATTRTTSAGTGREVTKGGLLQRPLALIMLPNGHLLACNAENGQVVELDPATGKQIYAQWIDTNQAQSPPGNGDLFGIALTAGRQGVLLCRGRHEHRDGGALSMPHDDASPTRQPPNAVRSRLVRSRRCRSRPGRSRLGRSRLGHSRLGHSRPGRTMLCRSGLGRSRPGHNSISRRSRTAPRGVDCLPRPAAWRPRSAPASPPAPLCHRPPPETRQRDRGFWGDHQAGIVTPAQEHTYFAAFDLTTEKRDDVVELLQTWTAAAAAMTSGQPIEPSSRPSSPSQSTRRRPPRPPRSRDEPRRRRSPRRYRRGLRPGRRRA